MKQLLNALYEHRTLSRLDAKNALTAIARGEQKPAQVASFLTVYMMRSITVAELEGFRDAMLELCVPVDLKEFDPMDLCGTGGDGKDTFNISSCSTFVAAAAGAKIAKHGNKAVSSACGSSDVLQYLGINFTADSDRLKRSMERYGISFLHAPLFHPAMKNVGPIRTELGVRTFFNILGPMINPAFVNKQMVGVFSLEVARLYNYLYQNSGKRYLIVHALDGYDEISLTGPVKIYASGAERLITPEDMGRQVLQPASLAGGATVEEAAGILTAVLKGDGTAAQREAVIANAGMALYCYFPGKSILEAQAMAAEALDSGRAWSILNKMRTDSEI